MGGTTVNTFKQESPSDLLKYLDSAPKSGISRPLFNIVPVHKVSSRCFHPEIISLCYQQRSSCVSGAVSL